MAVIEIEKGTEWHVRRQISNTLTDHDNRIVALEGGGGGGGQAAIQFEDEGSALGSAGSVVSVNFTGAGVTASRAGNDVTVNVGGGLALAPTIHTSGTSGTVPAGVSLAFITAQAAGGGGQAGDVDRGGAGGGGGAWCSRVPVTVTPAASYTFSIGAAGAGGSGTGVAGSSAADLTLTISGQTFTLEGGRGGNNAGGRGGMPLGLAVNSNGGTGSGGANGNPGGIGQSYGASGQGGGGGEGTPVSQTGNGGAGGAAVRGGGAASNGAGGGGAFGGPGGAGGAITPTAGSTPSGYGGGGGGGGNETSGPLWGPSDLGSALKLWLDASDSATITLSGSDVTDWDDKSGNGYTFVQATPSLRPSYQTAALNGLNTVRVVGGEYVRDSTFPIPQTYSVYTVGNRSGSLSSYRRMIGATSDVRFLLGALSNEYITMFGNSGSGWASTAVNTPAQTVALATGASLMGFIRNQSIPLSYPYFNGTAQNTITGNADAVTGMDVGWGGNQAGQHWEGDIAEVVFTDTVLSTSDREKLEGYLAHKWGIAAQLPSGHPYKTSPPTTGPGAPGANGGAGAPGILVLEWA